MAKACSSCKWWDKNYDERNGEAEDHGCCRSPRVLDGWGEADGVWGLEYGDMRGLLTGPDFGCIHWEEKTDG